jgi:hypothetical protein
VECEPAPPHIAALSPQFPHPLLTVSQHEQTCAMTATEKPSAHTIRHVAAQIRIGALIVFDRSAFIPSEK